MLNAISEQDRLELNRQLIIASYYCNFFLIEELIYKGADPNCRYDGSEFIAHSMLKYYIGSTPLIMATEPFKIISLSCEDNMGQTVHILLKNGADPSVMNNFQHNALYYAIDRVRGSRYHQGTTGTSEVEIVKDIVSHMKSEDLDVMVRWYDEIPNKYCELSLIEFTLSPHFGLTSSQQFEVAEILLNAGANPNYVDKKVINRFLACEMMSQLDFFMLFLAKGLRFDKVEKEALSKNSVLEFFVRSEVEFSGFFQNVKDDTELIDGLIKIKKCIRFKAQELAFSTWLKYGIEEFLSSKQKKSNIVINFLRQNTGMCIVSVADKLQRYLNTDDIKSLFFVLVGLELQESFVDAHEKEISELLNISIANIPDLNEHIDREFIAKSSNRKNNRNLIEKASEESLNYIRFLYEEEQKEISEFELLNISIANIPDLNEHIDREFIAKSSNRKNNRNLIEKASEESLNYIRFLYEEEQGNEEEQKDKKSVRDTQPGFYVYVCSSIYCSFIALLYCTLVTYSVVAIITAAIIGAAVGYGAVKLYEKVGEEKSKNPGIGTWTALTNVLMPECFKRQSIPESAILS